MRKFGIAIAVAVAGIALVGCSETDPNGQTVSEGDCPNEYGKPCAVTIDYKGRDLDCVSWFGSHGERGFTCDFVAYHQEDK
jgi:hypothetical protein